MDLYISQILLMANSYAIQDCLIADGSTLPTAQNQALYSLIGNHFGGTPTNFAIPDLNGRIAVGAKLTGVTPTDRMYFNLGEHGGANYFTFSVNNMPQHNHGATFVPTTKTDFDVKIPVNPTASGTASPENSFLGLCPGTAKIYAGAAADGKYLGGVKVTGSIDGGKVTIAPAGQGDPKLIMQPFLALNYMISIAGIYPMRP